MSILDLVGPSVVFKDENIQTSQQLTKKYTAFYFSANWCGPCKRFTPILMEWQANQNEVDLIFVSMDSDLDEYNAYRSKMSCAALPFECPQTNALADQFQVSGIPALVIVDASGKVIHENGRSLVVENVQLE